MMVLERRAYVTDSVVSPVVEGEVATDMTGEAVDCKFQFRNRDVVFVESGRRTEQ